MDRYMDYTLEQLVEAFEYLDEVRESGNINMFDSSRYVAANLRHDIKTARSIVSLWMQTYNDELSITDRANNALSKLK